MYASLLWCMCALCVYVACVCVSVLVCVVSMHVCVHCSVGRYTEIPDTGVS